MCALLEWEWQLGGWVTPGWLEMQVMHLCFCCCTIVAAKSDPAGHQILHSLCKSCNSASTNSRYVPSHCHLGSPVSPYPPHMYQHDIWLWIRLPKEGCQILDFFVNRGRILDLWPGSEKCGFNPKFEDNGLKSGCYRISKLPPLSVKYVCPISQKTNHPIMIPKIVLKSVLWRGSESALTCCIFQLLCFSLHPNAQELCHDFNGSWNLK